MRRKTRVVKSDSSTVPDASLLAPLAMADVPPPASSLDLFARFQQRSDDFSGQWLMLEEAEPPANPLISQSVADKLRRQQEAMRDLRSAGVATSNTKDNNNNNNNNNNNKNIGDSSDKKISAKGKDMYSTSDGSDVSDAEYEPGDAVAAAPRAPADGDGMQGDFLNFAPRLGDVAAVASSELQATLIVNSGNPHSQQGFPPFQQPQQQQQQHQEARSQAQFQKTQPLFKTRPIQQQLVVPLWSVDRFKQFGGYSSNVLVALHQEVCDLVDFLRPSQAEVSMRRMIEMEIAAIARRLWPECEPVVYGSITTHLMLPLSDLDMTVLNVPCSVEDALTALASEISKAGLCHTAYPQVIIKTKVPLVKFQHRLSLLDVDISINATDGPRNSAIVMDLLDTFPEARPLTILVKYFLHQRGMDEPYHGGLGSFATTLLVISFLQHHPIYRDRPEERAYSGLGRLLVDFFRYYGICFNYNNCGIAVHAGGRYFRRTNGGSTGVSSIASPRSPAGPAQVLIEDPGCPTNNAASSLRNFQSIVSVFMHAYMALTAVFANLPPESYSPDATDIRRRPTLLSRILHVDAEVVGRRQAIAAAYESLLSDPSQRERMGAVQAYRQEEDLPMLKAVRGRKRPRSASQGEDGCKGVGGMGTRKDSRSCSSSSYCSDISSTSSENVSEKSASNDSSVRMVASSGRS